MSATVQFQTSESSVYDHMDHQCQLQIKSGYSFSRVKPNMFLQTAPIMTNLESSALHQDSSEESQMNLLKRFTIEGTCYTSQQESMLEKKKANTSKDAIPILHPKTPSFKTFVTASNLLSLEEAAAKAFQSEKRFGGRKPISSIMHLDINM